MIFRSRFLHHCRTEIHKDHPNVNLINPSDWEDAVIRAHEQSGVSMPTFAVVEDGGVENLEAAFDGHIIKQIKEWFASPQGQNFLKILKAIVAALIAAIIAGS